MERRRGTIELQDGRRLSAEFMCETFYEPDLGGKCFEVVGGSTVLELDGRETCMEELVALLGQHNAELAVDLLERLAEED